MHRRSLTLSLFTLALLAALWVGAAPATSEEAAKPKPPVEILAGKVHKTQTGEGAAARDVYAITVGPQRHVLAVPVARARELERLVGKFALLRVPHGAEPKTLSGPVSLEKPVEFVAQKPVTVTGLVRVELGGTRKESYVLASADSAWIVTGKRVSRFRPHVGHHVEATGYRVFNTSLRFLDGVSKIVRVLAPGARDPKRGPDAIHGDWRGRITITKVPPGAPASSAGEYAVQFQAAANDEKATGRLFDTYDIRIVTVPAFKRRKRTATVTLMYSFGKGHHPCTLTGTFSPAWDRFEGDFTSKHIGSGTFVIERK